MKLFNLPKRDEISVSEVIEKTENNYPKISIRGGTLLDKLSHIKQAVNQTLGQYTDNYLLIEDEKEFLNYCQKASKCAYIAIDTETTGLSFNDQKNLVGLCIQGKGMKAAYIPVGHVSNITESILSGQISKEIAVKGLKIIYDANTKLIFHNAYYDLVVLYLATRLWFKCYWDTQVASYLLNENESHSLKDLYEKYCHGDSVHFSDLFDGLQICYIPPKVAYMYGAHDAEMTMKVFEFQKPFLTKGEELCKKYKLEQIVNIMLSEELPIIPILCKMKVVGVHIDLNRAKELHDKYTKLRDEQVLIFNKLTNFVQDLPNITYPINFNSPSQLKVLFYDILKCGIILKKDPTGTGAKVISEILFNKKYKDTKIYKIVKVLKEVKKYDKLLNTFIDTTYATALKYDGKLHGNFNSTATVTGRLSSSNPK